MPYFDKRELNPNTEKNPPAVDRRVVEVGYAHRVMKDSTANVVKSDENAVSASGQIAAAAVTDKSTEGLAHIISLSDAGARTVLEDQTNRNKNDYPHIDDSLAPVVPIKPTPSVDEQQALADVYAVHEKKVA